MKIDFRFLAGLAALALVACAPATDSKDKDDDENVTPVKTDFYLYSSAGTTDVVSTNDAWGSGTTIDSAYTGDSTYNPVIQLTSGTGWGDVSAIGFNEITPAGTLGQYTMLKFKVKATGYTTITVKFPASSLASKEKKYTIADGTPLAGGWTQMTIPFSDFETMGALENQVGIFEFGAGSILLTDVGFTGSAPVSNAALLASIASAEALLAATTVGTGEGNVPQAASDALSAAIAAAKTAPVSSWAEVLTANAAVAEATATFTAAKISLTPSTLAASPTLASSAVISLFNSSGTYTNTTIGNWNPGWGQSGSISDFTVAGKTVKKLDLQNYQGVDFDGNRFSIAGKTTLHFSYFSAAGSAFRLFLINAAGESPVTVSGLTADRVWTSVEVDFSTLTGFDFTTLRQLKFDVAGSGGAAGVYYLDNIYFH